MKTVLLMRHAKSSWQDHQLPEKERPLSEPGVAAARSMGTLLCERELIPQVILSSSATRACQTAEWMAQSSGYAGNIQFVNSFYLAEAPVYLGALSVLSDEVERVMLIGHNPGLESLLQILSGRIESLSAGNVAYLSLPLQSWRDLNAEVEGELLEIIVPENQREKIKEKGKKVDTKAARKQGEKAKKKKEK